MPEYCVTGGTGFIAAYIVKALLERGHTVRATVRDPGDATKVSFLWEFPGAKERLKLVKADLMVDGTFDEAVDGADGVFHVASPVIVPYDEAIQADNISLLSFFLDDLSPHFDGSFPFLQEKLIDPCIKGTGNVIRSCSKAKSVKRVVLTSSCSSIRYRDDATEVSPLNETHWSDPEYCKRHHVISLIPFLRFPLCASINTAAAVSPQLWYAYAKTLGEREAWRLADELGIDLVVVNPSFVVGPLLAPQPMSTLWLILSIVNGEATSYPNMTVGFVHIDDVVSGHILAMEEIGASGRLVCSGEVAHWSEIVEMLKNKYPASPLVTKCGDQKGDNNAHQMDTTKIRMLGHGGFKSLTEMFDDCIGSFQEKGFLAREGFSGRT